MHRSTTLARLHSVLVLTVALCALLTGCTPKSQADSAAGGAAPSVPATAIRVTLLQPHQGLRLELVSATHTSRASQYSATRTDASRKVSEDVFMAALLEFLEIEGWTRFEQPGPANLGGRGKQSAIEAERDGRASHVMVSSQSGEDEWTAFLAMQKGFLELYNAESAYQSVDSNQNPDPFGVTQPGGSR
jgi:hypothetical protein